MKSEKVTRKIAENIEYHYACHGISVRLKLKAFDAASGRCIFVVKLKPGTKLQAIFDRAQDVSAALQMPLFHLFYDEQELCLAVSRSAVSTCKLLEILSSESFQRSSAELPVALGYDLMGRVVVDDLGSMHHALYVGATGSGKSTGLITLITSLVCSLPADQLSLVLLDVGGRSMKVFEGIPHLACPVVKGYDEALYVLGELRMEMERRISLPGPDFQQLSHVVCAIDEFVAFIENIQVSALRQEFQGLLTDLIRRGRGVKIHMVLATQDPKRDSMGIDIGNITSRMAFRCAKVQTSVNVLNVGGAEKLRVKGSFLYISSDQPVPRYIQGAYIAEEELTLLISRIKEFGENCSSYFIIEPPVFTDEPDFVGSNITARSCISSRDREFARVIKWVLTQDTVSASQIKTQFSMGNRANEVLERLCRLNLVSEKFANKAREVLVRTIEDMPTEAVHILEAAGFSVEQLAVDFNKRECGEGMTLCEDGESSDSFGDEGAWSEMPMPSTVLPS